MSKLSEIVGHPAEVRDLPGVGKKPTRGNWCEKQGNPSLALNAIQALMTPHFYLQAS